MNHTQLSKETRSHMIRFGLLEGFYWAIWASFGGYVTSFCLYKGYEESLISMMFSIYMISAFAGQFFWGSICDKLKTNKKVFLAAVFLSGFVQIGMYYINSKAGFAILYATFGFILGPMGSILDTWLLRTLKYDMKNYGVSRSVGSAGYAFVILLTGMLIRKYGYGTMPLLSSVFVVITFLIACSSADIKLAESSNKGTISLKQILSILKIPSYLLLLGVMFFIGMANSPVNNLKIVILENVGGDVGTQGIDAFIGCMVQFLIFLISGAFTVIPAKIRMLVATLAMFVAVFLHLEATVVPVIIIGSILMNISYSFMMASSRELVFSYVKPEYQTTANGLCDASYSFISGTISMLYAGAVSERFGIRTMIALSLGMAAIAVLLMLISYLKKKK